MSRVFPPGPRGTALLGNLTEIRRDPLAFLLHVSAEYGDIVHFRLGPFGGFLLNHPDEIERVLVTQQHRFIKGRSLSGARRLFGNGLLTSDGALHARQRRLVQPAFNRSRLDEYARAMTLLGTEWCDRRCDGETMDIAAEMSRLTLAITTRILFGPDWELVAAEVAGALHAVTTDLDVTLLPFAALTDLLPLRHVRRLRSARATLDRVVDNAVERRRRAAVGGGDVLALLLSARDDNGEEMSHDQLRDEIVTLLLASHETTANALTWTWYLLARHPDADDRMHAEIAGAVARHPPQSADVPNLPFTRAVLAESMRLYPPAWLIARVAVDDHDAAGHVIPSGSLVVLSPWVVHRNSVYFPDPDRFDPQRWRPQGAARPRFSYFPFGGGSRGCMGEGFAWLEGVLLLATIAQRWRLRLLDDSLPAMRPALTLMPKSGIRVAIERRS